MLKLFLTFGMLGDYNLLRRLTLKYKLFYPLYKLYEVFHCANLPLKTDIKGNITFPHSPKGCFFSLFATIDTDCIIMQHVTIGSNNIKGGGIMDQKLAKMFSLVLELKLLEI